MIALLRELGIIVIVATTTQEAMTRLSTGPFDAVISDMRRGTVEDEGQRMLAQMRQQNMRHPVIFTVGRYYPDRGTPGHAFGITHLVDEMLNLLFDALERVRG